MNQPDMSFIVPRASQDRRSGDRLPPPYLTEEGMVLIDRRSPEDRRAAARNDGAYSDGRAKLAQR
jgi:hypothetical protein